MVRGLTEGDAKAFQTCVWLGPVAPKAREGNNGVNIAEMLPTLRLRPVEMFSFGNGPVEMFTLPNPTCTIPLVVRSAALERSGLRI